MVASPAFVLIGLIRLDTRWPHLVSFSPPVPVGCRSCEIPNEYRLLMTGPDPELTVRGAAAISKCAAALRPDRTEGRIPMQFSSGARRGAVVGAPSIDGSAHGCVWFGFSGGKQPFTLRRPVQRSVGPTWTSRRLTGPGRQPSCSTTSVPSVCGRPPTARASA